MRWAWWCLLLGGLLRVASASPQAVILSVTGPIDLGLAPYSQRVLREAAQRGATTVIVHLNTPGGRVDAAIAMRDALLASPLRTVAFVDREAYSAGALIALAAHELYMRGGAVIGAATPVDPQGQKAGEKYVSAIRKLFRATAEYRGRPPEIAEAMVDEDVAIAGLVDKGKLLTLTTQEALRWGVADGQFETLAALLAHLGLSPESVQAVPLNWAEHLVRFLSRPLVASLLLSLGLLALLAEVYTPGFGLAGSLGLASLALFFGSHYLVGLAGWEEALLLGAGVLLLALELLVLPGFGLAGLLGLGALGAGVFLSLLGRYPAPADLWRAGFVVLAALATVGLGAAAMLVLLPGTPLWSRLRLKASLAPAAEAPAAAPPVRVGQVGVTLTPLRPAGSGDFDGKRLDILSEGPYIPAATPVVVVRVEGNRFVVRPAAPPAAGPSHPQGDL
ncbi:MAG: hypothetical protein KatS3mg131_1584 [Candidatus Tectimicrobiota bacterium]|nr:MAG: hypothetical protein KatS3mg131_1584 [Candidatus Tectomicrobia bacterium]